jgi:hypothetical protein
MEKYAVLNRCFYHRYIVEIEIKFQFIEFDFLFFDKMSSGLFSALDLFLNVSTPSIL